MPAHCQLYFQPYSFCPGFDKIAEMLHQVKLGVIGYLFRNSIHGDHGILFPTKVTVSTSSARGRFPVNKATIFI
ncbi:MAG: hypothetical protein ACLFUC_01090 [Bacteroidales bacterium]